MRLQGRCRPELGGKGRHRSMSPKSEVTRCNIQKAKYCHIHFDISTKIFRVHKAWSRSTATTFSVAFSFFFKTWESVFFVKERVLVHHRLSPAPVISSALLRYGRAHQGKPGEGERGAETVLTVGPNLLILKPATLLFLEMTRLYFLLPPLDLAVILLANFERQLLHSHL